MKNFKYLIVFFSISLKLQAYDIGLSAGNLCEYIGKIQTNDAGATNLCSFNPYFASSVDIPIADKILLSPEIGISFPQKGRDKNISKLSMFALTNAKYKFSTFYFLSGAGLFFTRIAGKGGSQNLNNGNNTTSFPMPDSAVYTRNFIINVGLGYDYDKEWSANLQSYIFNIVSKEDRAFSVALNGTYHFGEWP